MRNPRGYFTMPLHHPARNYTQTLKEDCEAILLADRLVIVGGVNSVVEQILAFRDTIGDFGTLLYCGHDWIDPALARRSMELMANDVMPRVNKALRTP